MEWLFAHLRYELFSLSNTAVTPLALMMLALTVALSVVAGRLARGLVTRFFRRGEGVNQGIAYAVGRMAQYTTFLVGTLIGFENVGFRLSALAAVGAVVTVGIGFGLQNIAQNFISGIILLIERPVQKGDFIMVGDTVGTVIEIAMRATKVVSRDGVAIIIPNSELIAGRVVNQSQPNESKRVRVAVGVAYGSDTEVVRDTLLEVGRGHAEVLGEPPPRVFFRNFGESALEFELTVWIRDPKPEPAVSSDLRFAIEASFRRRGVGIPGPQRELVFRRESAPLRVEFTPRARDAVEGRDVGGSATGE